MALKYHPDRKGGNTDKFNKLSDAQELLLKYAK